jgi:hypothetical protein
MESLVAASGYKFSKADRKLGKKKLKTPQGTENETNGTVSRASASDSLLTKITCRSQEWRRLVPSAVTGPAEIRRGNYGQLS